MLQQHLVAARTLLEVLDPLSSGWTLEIILHLELGFVILLGALNTRAVGTSTIVALVKGVLLDEGVDVFGLGVTYALIGIAKHSSTWPFYIL